MREGEVVQLTGIFRFCLGGPRFPESVADSAAHPGWVGGLLCSRIVCFFARVETVEATAAVMCFLQRLRIITNRC